MTSDRADSGNALNDGAASRPADFLQAVIRTAAEGICVYSDVPHFPYMSFSVWNDRMTELTGYTVDEINRLGWYQTMYPDPASRKAADACMAKLRAGGEINQEEWTITRKDGTRRTLSISTRRVSYPFGPSVVALMSDVTDRIAAERALRESEARLADSQRIAHLGSYEWDCVSGVVWWSDELYRIFDLDPSTFVPGVEAYKGLLPEEDRSLVQDAIDQTLERDAPFFLRHRYHRRDGTLGWVRAEGRLERAADGTPVCLRGTCLDVTDVKRASDEKWALQTQLDEARRLESMGAMAGGIAHEFNNLLTTILGYSDLAAAELGRDHPVAEHLAPIRSAAMRAAALCRQMLAFAGKERMILGVVDLAKLAQDAALAAPDFVVAAPTDGPCLVRGDAAQVRRLLANLIENSKEAGAKRVTISCARVAIRVGGSPKVRHLPPPGEHHVLSVADDGPGMDATALARAFEPFFSTKFPGRGLGLAVVLGIARSHGGGVDITSTPSGTTVRVFLPVAGA